MEAEKIAQEMLGLHEPIPDDLLVELINVEQLIKKFKPHGALTSTQVIAKIIVDWEKTKFPLGD